MRLSAALTRRDAPVATFATVCVPAAVITGEGVATCAAEVLAVNEDRSAKRSAAGPLGGKLGIAGCNAGLDDSSQDNIEISNVWIMKACERNAKQCFEMK